MLVLRRVDSYLTVENSMLGVYIESVRESGQKSVIAKSKKNMLQRKPLPSLPKLKKKHDGILFKQKVTKSLHFLFPTFAVKNHLTKTLSCLVGN